MRGGLRNRTLDSTGTVRQLPAIAALSQAVRSKQHHTQRPDDAFAAQEVARHSEDLPSTERDL